MGDRRARLPLVCMLAATIMAHAPGDDLHPAALCTEPCLTRCDSVNLEQHQNRHRLHPYLQVE